MREIKFRVWSHIAKRMYAVSALTFEENTLSDIGVAVYGNFSAVIDQESFQTIELMQFTGLTDKNGTEIYEGDVVRAYPEPPDHPDQRSCLYAVQFSDFEGMWILKDERAIEHCPALFPGGIKSQIHRYLEVIGNIYENPDLLKEIKA